MKSKAVLIFSTLLVLLAISQAYGVKEVYPGNGTLKDVIEKVNPGETIFLHNGTYYDSGIVIDKNLTIAGKDKDGVVIDAQREGPIFYIDAYTDVRLINLTLINGNGTEGGAINNNGYLVVENCKFKNNYASEEGGAIYNNGNLEISNSEFMGNVVELSDSGWLGSAIANHCILNITRSTFSNEGSAIYNSYEGSLYMENCTHINHKAGPASGGAIINEGVASIEGSIFKNNLAYHGGAIYNNGSMNLTECLFAWNAVRYTGGAIDNAGNLTIDNCGFENNSAGCWGGAIDNAGNLKITNSIFNKNMVDGDGGAISNDGDLIIDNCTFNNNNATSYGGAISTSDNLTVTNSLFKCNKAGEDGGAIYVSPGIEYKEPQPSIIVDNSNIFIDNLPNDSNIPLENVLDYNITLTNTGKSTITIKCYISIYTNSVNGKKVGYKEVTITLKPKETKRIYLGKYPAGHIVSGTMIVKNPSKKRIQLNLQVKYEIEGFDPEIRKISNYIAPRKEFKYSVKYRVNEYGSIEVR